MGLRGEPSLLDLRTAVATYNFEDSDERQRAEVSTFMSHDLHTQERFYALHKTVGRAKAMRDIFIRLSVAREEKEPAPPSTSAASTATATTTITAAAAAAASAASTPKRNTNQNHGGKN
ncbi:uncharacterized protein V6R79_000861 [Siganus canaliculatus]